MGFKKFSLYISELSLRRDSSETWLNEPKVLVAWHSFFFSFWAGAGLDFIMRFVLTDFFVVSAPATFGLRCFDIVWTGVLISELSILAALHFRFLLLTGRDLRLSSVAFFWTLWVTLFAFMYRNCYTIRPSLFLYPSPVVTPRATLGLYVGLWSAIKEMTHFVVYSACVSTSLLPPGLASNSMTVSALNVVEVIGSLLTVGLLIATIVGKSINGREG
jgi:hypothetical protein